MDGRDQRRVTHIRKILTNFRNPPTKKKLETAVSKRQTSQVNQGPILIPFFVVFRSKIGPKKRDPLKLKFKKSLGTDSEPI